MQVFLETIISEHTDVVLKNVHPYRTRPKPQDLFLPLASRRHLVPDAPPNFVSLRSNASQTTL